MARKTETLITLTDDLDGSTKNIETVTFSVDGQTFGIDLGPKNAKALQADLGKWSEHARKVKRASDRRTRGTAPKPVSDAAATREWAAVNGIKVSARGRISKAVADQYSAAR